MAPKRMVQLSMDDFVEDDDASRFKRSRFSDILVSDTRTVVQAYGEYCPISRNEYICRMEKHMEKTDDNEICGGDCENRAMQIECVTGNCTTGRNCSNQRFQRSACASLFLAQTAEKGIVLFANEFIEREELVIEYTGEVMDNNEYKRRQQLLRGTRHFYGVQLNAREELDATRKGSLARFANHSCAPNCKLELWEVGGETCCGLFALETIAPHEEITLFYSASLTKLEARRCMCGSTTCKGYIPM
ncbi:hypothetical protein F441_13067 [Phytophthora nicotianae CJ01A1]|nr:hypothetical protein F441_13067 [Phytophthora nicotianae CJ01A1]